MLIFPITCSSLSFWNFIVGKRASSSTPELIADGGGSHINTIFTWLNSDHSPLLKSLNNFFSTLTQNQKTRFECKCDLSYRHEKEWKMRSSDVKEDDYIELELLQVQIWIIIFLFFLLALCFQWFLLWLCSWLSA